MRRILLLGVLALLSLPAQWCLADSDADGAAQDQKISQLIAQLGDPEYAVRERAQQDLGKLGFAAFDALTEAENSDDIEIAAQARYLVKLIRVDWTQENDPAQVRQILKDYELQSEVARLQRIKMLADLPGDIGMEFLCRLARFEQSHLLAKHAALAVINEPLPPGDEAWNKRSKLITRTLDRSNRTAARWLKTYVQARQAPDAALAEWKKLAELEEQTLEQFPQQSQNQFVMQLLRQQIDTLDRLGRTDDATKTMQKMVAIERGDSQSLTELVDWLAERKAWPIIDEVAAKFSGNFDADALLLYTLAQARLAQGSDALAEEAAAKALKINSDKAAEHLLVAFRLSERGLMKWSDREYRFVIDIGPPHADAVIKARSLLAENLHDRQEDLAAAEVLKGLADGIDKDRLVSRAVNQQGRDAAAIKSRMHFFFAQHQASLGDRAKQKELLDKGLAEDPTDADVLIALYQYSDKDPAERKKVVELIKKAGEQQRAIIEEAPDDPTAYNQLAWLIANTEGDFDEAIRLSHKSIELKRAGGYLDTLGHCYAAKGDFENAVRYQTEASKLDPHSQAIIRKLEVFRKALAEKQPAAKSDDKKPAADKADSPKPEK